MAQSRQAQRGAVKERPPPSLEQGASLLWRGVLYSGLLHAGLISSLWILPHVPYRRAPEYPVYSVDLVGGEKLGATTLGTEPPPPEPKKETKKVKVEPPPPVQAVQKETLKKEATKKEAPIKEKTKPAEEPASIPEELKLEKSKKEAKETPQAAEGLPESVREKLIQAALQRVRDRAEAVKSEDKVEKAAKPQKAEKEVISAGPGEGAGAAAVGAGGRGGGIVKAVEFLVYRNQMLRVIRDRWTWVGKRSDLEVTVRFAIRENGEIERLRIIRASGDPSYDDSVVRAVTKSSPLPPPPENYRKEFMDVELTFRPKDLGA